MRLDSPSMSWYSYIRLYEIEAEKNLAPRKVAMDTYLKVLDPDDSSAGGGSASAIAGAMAGALLALVAKFSRPSLRKMGEASPAVGEDAPFEGMAERTSALSQRLRAGAREDTEAFQALRDSYRLPKDADAEKAARQRAVQEAWNHATRKPLENAEACLALLEIGLEVQDRVNPKVHSDYSSGLYLARAGLLAASTMSASTFPR